MKSAVAPDAPCTPSPGSAASSLGPSNESLMVSNRGVISTTLLKSAGVSRLTVADEATLLKSAGTSCYLSEQGGATTSASSKSTALLYTCSQGQTSREVTPTPTDKSARSETSAAGGPTSPSVLSWSCSSQDVFCAAIESAYEKVVRWRRNVLTCLLAHVAQLLSKSSLTLSMALLKVHQ